MCRICATVCFAVIVVLGGCGYVETSPDSYRNPRVDPDAQAAQKGSVFGVDGLNLLGGKKTDQGSGGIGVNSFLWRASLDTLAFMPLASADPFGGVIITDWYSPPETPDERFEVNISILDRQLRSDGVRARSILVKPGSRLCPAQLRRLVNDGADERLKVQTPR
jgi:hypothetical protein